MEEALKTTSESSISYDKEDENIRLQLEMIYMIGIGANITSLASTYAQILFINTLSNEIYYDTTTLIYASIDLACKISGFEVDRLHLDSAVIELIEDFSISDQLLIEVQANILKSINWNLNFMPVTMLYIQISASMQLDYFNEEHLAILEGLHFDSRIKDIKYFESGVFDPFLLAISLFSDDDIIYFLNDNFIFIDFNEIEIAREFLNIENFNWNEFDEE